VVELLKVDQLRFQYGTRVAVDGVSFVIHRGELFGLLGANGAGKTTTISCISGLLTDWQGSLSMAGQAFSPAKSNKDRLMLGIVPQELAVYEGLTARENLRLFGKLSGLSGPKLSERVDEMLELAGLKDRARDLVSAYSGGMKRRLNLAIGVIHHPQLLLLDEPTVGVDPQSRNHLFESLLQLKQQGMTMLYTTHYMEEAQRLCDRIAVVNEGKVIAIGTSAELAASIGDPQANLEQVFLHLTGRTLRDE
jgi:ABC-2 type transport system ATP-binding protein